MPVVRVHGVDVDRVRFPAAREKVSCVLRCNLLSCGHSILHRFRRVFLQVDKLKTVGPPGIEPGLHPPHGCVLPVYYGPDGRRRSVSGRRESNPVFTHPKRTYYRYTTARHFYYKRNFNLFSKKYQSFPIKICQVKLYIYINS